MARRAPDLLEVVVLAGHAQAALVVDGPVVRARLRAGQDVLELDHAGVREQQRLVAGRDEARAGHDRVAALGEELDEPAADLGGGQRDDARVPVGMGVDIGRNGTQRTVSRRPQGRPTAALMRTYRARPLPSTGPRRSRRNRRWRSPGNVSNAEASTRGRAGRNEQDAAKDPVFEKLDLPDMRLDGVRPRRGRAGGSHAAELLAPGVVLDTGGAHRMLRPDDLDHRAKQVPAVALIANVLVVLVAAIHVYIVVLEMFLWRTPRGFRRSGPIRLRRPSRRRWRRTRACTTASSSRGSSGASSPPIRSASRSRSSSWPASSWPGCTARPPSAAGSWSSRPCPRPSPWSLSSPRPAGLTRPTLSGPSQERTRIGAIDSHQGARPMTTAMPPASPPDDTVRSDDDDRLIGRVLTRREVLALMGVSVGRRGRRACAPGSGASGSAERRGDRGAAGIDAAAAAPRPPRSPAHCRHASSSPS